MRLPLDDLREREQEYTAMARANDPDAPELVAEVVARVCPDLSLFMVALIESGCPPEISNAVCSIVCWVVEGRMMEQEMIAEAFNV